eukprot:TRINITY_DN31632_c0_g1_i1.p1 TRINITY_DN31632_c0_g1~~TRINITY_DN31632_c0_g1_i1.p1  ORF type:complete len:584 (-),score=141.28 TRINITY_DN31632_c0_g1_i1:174-1844(-)
MKVLIVDAETIGIISMVFSMSSILNYEVFRVERIEMENTEKMRHMNAICFLRPTKQNFLFLAEMLKSPNYNEYHIFFSNAVPPHRLEKLACYDEMEAVHQVQEYYADIYAIGHDLFSLNLPSTIRLCEEHDRWTEYEQSVFERIVEGLVSACLNLQILPAIRYNGSSAICQQAAHRLQQRIVEELSLFEELGSTSKKRSMASPIVLLLDRRNDPVTPLLNQWTYQAMVHELLTVENNRVDMSNVPGIREDLKELVMSPSQDQFFEKHLLSYFPDLLVSVQKSVEAFAKKTETSQTVCTIEDMARFVEKYPEFRRESSLVAKHVEVINELQRIVKANGLFTSSQLEQDIACNENKQEHYQELIKELNGSNITNMQRLRLVLLYALRYEDRRHNAELKKLLLKKKIGEEQVQLVDKLLSYSGSHVRSGDLFGNKTALSRFGNAWNAALKGDLFTNRSVIEALTLHKGPCGKVAEDLMKGRLDEAMFPFVERVGYTTNSRDPPPRAIVFIIGGTTYEESRDITMLNRSLSGGRYVVLGGTSVHNSRSFLAEVAQLGSDD